MNITEAVAALEEGKRTSQKYVSTGSLALDMSMGGWPVGRLSEITGDEMSGKTTLAYVAAAEMQRLREGPVLWLDMRGEFSPRKAAQAGVDTGNMLISHGLPKFGLGPVRYVVADAVTGWQEADGLLELTAGGRTVVATSWRYRMFVGQFPWVDLRFRGGDGTTASVSAPSIHDVAVSRLHITPNGIDSAMELLDLGQKAGLVIQRGGHWYLKGSPTDMHLGSGREQAGRKLLTFPEVSEQVRSVLTES